VDHVQLAENDRCWLAIAHHNLNDIYKSKTRNPLELFFYIEKAQNSEIKIQSPTEHFSSLPFNEQNNTSGNVASSSDMSVSHPP